MNSILKLYSIAGEKIAFITLFGVNRNPYVLIAHNKVMVEHFGVPVNYINCPFPSVSHGSCMDKIIRETIDTTNAPDYYWWWDNDCVAMNVDIFKHVYHIVSNKRTVWGQAWNSSHLKGPNGTFQHPYASQACLCFSRDLYKELGSPSCHHSNRSDTAEEITYQAEFRGFTVALQYPSYSDTKTTELSNGCFYGRGNIYGPNLTYHESRADLPDHADRFILMCHKIIEGKFK